MLKVIRITAFILILIVLVPIIVAVSYEIIVFYQYKSNLDEIITQTHPLHRNPPETAYNLAVLSEGKERIKSYAAQILLCEFSLDKNEVLVWPLDYASWTILIGIIYNEKEIFTLWCHIAPYEEGRGLNRSAIYRYNKDLNQLSLEELATVIALVKAPIHFSKNSEKLNKRVNDLIIRYKYSLERQ